MDAAETDIEALRRQLDLPRDRAVALGREAVEIIDRGAYETAQGRRISIAAARDAARERTVEYGPADPVPPPRGAATLATKILVRNETTLTAARRLMADGHDVAAFNFASATHPGGGFLVGSRAQEEYLARSSALFACLRGRRMYEACAGPDPFYADFVIWSPGVPVFRDDDGRLIDAPWLCTILTSPAVQANAVRRYMPARVGEIAPVMRERARRVLAVAAAHGHRALVLGAWGCGAFGNDPRAVAGMFRDLLRGEFAARFAVVVFAVTDWSPERRFIEPFEIEFGGEVQ